MITLHVPLWALMWRGMALSVVALFMIRGHAFKRRLRRDLMMRGQRGSESRHELPMRRTRGEQ
jgi:hypothetical protein